MAHIHVTIVIVNVIIIIASMDLTLEILTHAHHSLAHILSNGCSHCCGEGACNGSRGNVGLAICTLDFRRWDTISTKLENKEE